MIVYNLDGPWGSATHTGPLTTLEWNYNFWDLDFRIMSLESYYLTAARGIDTFEVSASQMTVLMTDSTTEGPFNLPVATLRRRTDNGGHWAPLTAYTANELFDDGNGSLYVVQQSHTSASGSFDPSATDGHGHNLYGLMFTSPGSALPVSGATGDALEKTSSADFAVAWVTRGKIPTGGDTDDVLSKTSTTNYATGWRKPVPRVVTVATATYSITAADNFKYLRFTNGSGCVVTFPVDATVDLPDDFEVILRNASGSVLTVDWEYGAVVHFPDDTLTTVSSNNASVAVKKVGADEYDAEGRFDPA